MARNPRIFRRTATLVTVVLATTGMSNAATFFEGLGLIPGSMQGSINAPEATGISADGTVAVGYSQEQAFRWTQSGGMVGLGFLNLMNGHGNSYSMGTSSNGSTVAGYSLNASAKLEAFRWTQATGMIGLGYLPGGVYSTASAINSNGSVVVGTSNGTADPSSQGQAFRWTQTTGIVGLGFLPGTNYSSAAAVNYSGSIVVGGSGTNLNTIFTEQAFRWTQTTGMVGLGFLSGVTYSSANGTNSDGSVVVGFSQISASNLNVEAFRWTQASGMVGLGFLPGGTNSIANATNADGSVVVGYEQDASFKPTAFIWTQSGGMQSIKDLLIANGDWIAGCILDSATGVSADGKVIVGWGYDPSGQYEPWIANLSTTVTPLPAALSLFATGLGVLGLLGWRRKHKGAAAPQLPDQNS